VPQHPVRNANGCDNGTGGHDHGTDNGEIVAAVPFHFRRPNLILSSSPVCCCLLASRLFPCAFYGNCYAPVDSASEIILILQIRQKFVRSFQCGSICSLRDCRWAGGVPFLFSTLTVVTFFRNTVFDRCLRWRLVVTCFDHDGCKVVSDANEAPWRVLKRLQLLGACSSALGCVCLAV
jgi:hypothetical protein